MANNLMIHEILQQVDAEKSTKRKIDILRENDSNALRHILRGALDDNVVWLLPHGEPPDYKPDYAPEGLQMSSIHKATPAFYLFCQAGIDSGKAAKLKSDQRNRLFTQMLESLHVNDAAIIIQMKDKNLKCRGLTKGLVNEAFPGLIQEKKWN